MNVSPLNQKIRDYLRANPLLQNSHYAETARKFKVSAEIVRHQAKAVRAENPSPKDVVMEEFKTRLGEVVDVPAMDGTKDSTFTEDFSTGEATHSFVTKTRIKTLQDLIDLDMLDLDNFKISSYQVTTWEGYRSAKTVNTQFNLEGKPEHIANDPGGIITETLYRVAVKLQRITADNNLQKQKEVIFDALTKDLATFKPKETLAKLDSLAKEFTSAVKDCALEINIPDLHLGKLAWAEESGDDYDVKIAVARYKDAVRSLISRTPIRSLKKIILIVGHDFLNVDGKNNLTTAGTPQSSDTRFYKMVKIGKLLLIETIDELSGIIPVDVVVVPGNHDSNSMLLMGDILDAHYRNTENVTILNTPAPRMYYQFGVNGNMYTHGHNEKINDMGIIFATENPNLWAATRFHRVHIGHFHHNRQVRIKDIQEQHGCVVKIINSLSADDAWHSDKAFLSLQGAEAFLYHETQGLLANYYYYI